MHHQINHRNHHVKISVMRSNYLLGEFRDAPRPFQRVDGNNNFSAALFMYQCSITIARKHHAQLIGKAAERAASVILHKPKYLSQHWAFDTTSHSATHSTPALPHCL
jgi:hypothetical protein